MSQRENRGERLSLPAGMELVVPPPPREEWEDRRSTGSASPASRVGPFPPLVVGGSPGTDVERRD